MALRDVNEVKINMGNTEKSSASAQTALSKVSSEPPTKVYVSNGFRPSTDILENTSDTAV